MAKWVTVHYQCINPRCKAKDSDRLLADKGEAPIPAINCWKCGSGRGLEVPAMLEQNRGMRIYIPQEQAIVIAPTPPTLEPIEAS